MESLLCMKTVSYLSAIILGAALACAPALSFSQPPQSSDKGARQDMKNAGHDTKNAAKSAGRGVKKGSQKGYHATKHGTEKAAKKTGNTAKGAVDGAKQGAKQPQP